MSRSPAAIRRIFTELQAGAPQTDADDMILSGILAFKSGYHNTRANHEAGKLGGKPNDYSIRFGVDQLGADDAAAAIDITFRSAQAGDFRMIAKYSRRLYDAMRAEDPRLFYRGEPVIREFFGNIDTDRDVEGWSMRRSSGTPGPVTSDGSHLWHLHQSIFRKFVDDWDALKGIPEVLLGRPLTPVPPPIEEDDVTPEQMDEIADRVLNKAKLGGVGPWSGLTLAEAVAGISGKEDADKLRDAAERDRDAAQDRQLSQLNDSLATVRNASNGQLSRLDNIESALGRLVELLQSGERPT